MSITSDRKDRLYEFIKGEKLAVISTIDNENNRPESAVLEFGQTEDLVLIFDTFTSSRKYKNLQSNQSVSFVIGWDENITIQYEGIAHELYGEEKIKYTQIYWDKNPDAQRWENSEGIIYFKVVPRWIRYSDLNQDPWLVFEIKFD